MRFMFRFVRTFPERRLLGSRLTSAHMSVKPTGSKPTSPGSLPVDINKRIQRVSVPYEADYFQLSLVDALRKFMSQPLQSLFGIPVKAAGCSRNGTLFDFTCNDDESLALNSKGVVNDSALSQTAMMVTARIILQLQYFGAQENESR